MYKFLVIQTAFTGDVILATALAESLKNEFPDASIHFMVRRGNEGLLIGHPFISKVYIWDKKRQKKRNLLKIAFAIRRNSYTHIINLQRFAATGIVTWLSGALHRYGFDKNPFSFCYTKKVAHIIGTASDTTYAHEIERNHLLVNHLCQQPPALPKLYPSPHDREQVAPLQKSPYICIAPASVWYTKQWPAEKWASLINDIPDHYHIYLLGGPGDAPLAEHIKTLANKANVWVTCGDLNYLQSAALMQDATMNYTNDSAPLHMATAMQAPVTAVFCSTIPQFGFGPIGKHTRVIETQETLACKPCGLHGKKACPEKHFKCALTINNDQLLWWTSN